MAGAERTVFMRAKTEGCAHLSNNLRGVVAIVCVLVLVPGDVALFAQTPEGSASPPAEEKVKLPADQLDSLVAPIALYPDPLLAQILVASTYPLEVFNSNSGCLRTRI